MRYPTLLIVPRGIMKFLFHCLLFFISWIAQAQNSFAFDLVTPGKATTIYYGGKDQVVATAVDMLLSDAKLVSSQGFILQHKLSAAAIVVGTLQDKTFEKELREYAVDAAAIQGVWEGFQLQVVKKGNKEVLLVIGSDPRGTAYGVLEVSRLLGVDPWVWWADVVPKQQSKVVLASGYKNTQKPAVQYRGIFLNDEDWGLMPWSSQTYEPTDRKGQIGPKTYSRIFELLLRLRANTLWPAMHEVTIPFYFTAGNREAAAQYGIILGTSHCEPLMRNSAREWDVSGTGDYNYITNKDEIHKYWIERLKELEHAENIFTIGLRGKHDGMMQGVKTLAEHKAVLSRVLPDQRELIKKYINPDPTQVPQVFIPYKEVLDVYNDGLDVPEDVTLVWCDDNYGYLKHFPNDVERARQGGNGVYYHVSYWGRPHDYLWLSIVSPALIHHQMSLAYDKGVHKLWILNVGDIKPSEYQTELFLDMAWDIEAVNQQGVAQHLQTWLERKFGSAAGEQLLPILQEHHRLAYIRKPEHMGNTRVEESDPAYKVVSDLPWSEEEIRQRLYDYSKLTQAVERLVPSIAADQQDAFFQLVEYPILAAAQMNEKMLKGQLARHQKADWKESHTAFDRIISLTATYNNLLGGKWNRMMDYKPRNLAVFHRLHEEVAATALPSLSTPLYSLSAQDERKQKVNIIEGLGYTGRVMSIAKGDAAEFEFDIQAQDSIVVEVRLLPNHPVDDKQLRFAIALNNNSPKEVSYKTQGRSEEWKQNVLRNQAIRRVTFPLKDKGKQQLRIAAMDEGVVLDQVLVF